jgi:hypothetical protein
MGAGILWSQFHHRVMSVRFERVPSARSRSSCSNRSAGGHRPGDGTAETSEDSEWHSGHSPVTAQ